MIAVTIDICPHLDALPRDAFDGKAATIDQRIDVFNKENATGRGTLDSLNCLVHGDAIDKETASRFPCREPARGTYIESPSCVISSSQERSQRSAS